MEVLVTGASGFLGRALTPKLVARGDTVYGLSRHPPEVSEKLIPLVGDITELNLGLNEVPKGIQAVYHLAAIHHLGKDKDGNIWKTNVVGTSNVIDFCLSHNIPRLYFCSTAFTIGSGRNPYEESKILCEKMVHDSGIPHVTIFKPSVVMGTKEHPYPGHFSQFVTLLIKAHGRAELIRRKVEGTLRLPILEPVFRFRGNPGGCLNLVTVDAVAEGISKFKSKGTHWLTNPYPPTLGQLADWISEVIMVRFRIQSNNFHKTPIEAMVAQRASAFEPYLWGDSFPSHLRGHPPITKEFIHETIISLHT